MSKILECVNCHKRTTDYEAEDRILNPNNCGHCGGALREVPELSKDTIMQGINNTLLMISLNHSSSIIELATRLIAAGPLKPNHYKRSIDEFKRVHKRYSDEYEKVIKQAEAELSND